MLLCSLTMAISITPGYDFTVQEVPTELLFKRQAEDLKITGIPASQIEGTITAIVFGDTTGASGATPPAVGWIWVDSAGHRNLRVTEPNADVPRVDVRVWNAHGGYESSRPDVDPTAANDGLPDGGHLWGQATRTFKDARLDMDINDTPVGIGQVLVGCPVTNTRILMRGLGVAACGLQVTETLLRTHRPGILTDVAPSGADWRVLDMFGGHKAHFAGTVLGRTEHNILASAISTGESFALAEVAVWFVGRNLGKS